MERSRVRGTDAMDDARLDPAAAAREQEIRGQCSLRVAGVYGSLAGRTGRSVRAACLEPGGGHAVLLLSDGALERWDLDAVERVGRWELPLLRGRRSLGCDGPAPWDVFAIDREGRRWRVAEAAEAWRDEGVIVTDGFVDKMRVGRSVVVSRRWSRWDPRLRATRLHDGEVLWETGSLGRCDPEGRYLLVMRTRTSFTLLDALDGMRVVARLKVRREQPLIRRQALHAPSRCAALVGSSAVVLGSWDDWSSARMVTVPERRWTFAEFTADGRTLVLCARGPVVRIDVATLESREAALDEGPIEGPIAFDPTSGRLLHVRLHVAPFVADAGDRAWRAVASDPSRVVVAAGTRDGRTLITATAGGAIRVRDRATGEVLVQMEAPDEVPDLAVSPDGRELFAPGRSALLRWTLATGEPGEPIALPRSWRWTSRQIAISPSGRHVLQWSRHAEEGELWAWMTDLATGTTRRWTPPRSARASSLDVVALVDGDLPLRLTREASEPGVGRVRECGGCSLDGTRFEPLFRWSGDEVYEHPCTLWSRDGRLVWRLRSFYREGSEPVRHLARPRLTMQIMEPAGALTYLAGPLQIRVTDADTARTTFARWEFDWREDSWQVGRSLLALATVTPESVRSLWLFSVNGRSVCAGWAGRCVPLAFAPDDRALWVRDEGSGLVVELAVPDELLDGVAT